MSSDFFRSLSFSNIGMSLETWSSSMAQWRAPSVRKHNTIISTKNNKRFLSDSIVMVSCIFSSLVVAKSARECHFLCQVVHLGQVGLTTVPLLLLKRSTISFSGSSKEPCGSLSLQSHPVFSAAHLLQVGLIPSQVSNIDI